MLHLTAFDAEDLPALSAQLQDAVLRAGDMVFNARRKSFACVVNRFAWDGLPEKTRRRCGLRINHVLSARRLHKVPVREDSILSLLALGFEAEGEIGGTLTLHFSGGHAIALKVDSVDVQMDDLGPAWGTAHEPSHNG